MEAHRIEQVTITRDEALLWRALARKRASLKSIKERVPPTRGLTQEQYYSILRTNVPQICDNHYGDRCHIPIMPDRTAIPFYIGDCYGL